MINADQNQDMIYLGNKKSFIVALKRSFVNDVGKKKKIFYSYKEIFEIDSELNKSKQGFAKVYSIICQRLLFPFTLLSKIELLKSGN